MLQVASLGGQTTKQLLFILQNLAKRAPCLRMDPYTLQIDKFYTVVCESYLQKWLLKKCVLFSDVLKLI